MSRVPVSYARQIRFPQASRGVGLIEVLIAILVMAIGLLGVAALQATTLRNSQGATERSQATIQTYAIFDAMRANAEQANAYAANVFLCNPAAIDRTALVGKDLGRWIDGLSAQLGNSSTGATATACGKIRPVGAGSNVYEVTVRWNDERGGAGAAQQIITVTQL